MISLGGNCSVAYQLKKYDKRRESYPFDWCNMKIDQLIRVLENDFIDYEDIRIVKFSDKHLNFKTNEGSYILTNKYGIKFAHELINELEIDELKSKIKRRIERFKLLRNVIFVRLEINNINEEKMNLKYNQLNQIISNYYQSKLIVISKFRIENIYKWIRLEEFEEDWKYDKVNWKDIFCIR